MKLFFYLIFVHFSYGFFNNLFTRRTILDIGIDRKFKNDTYFQNFDITVARRTTLSKNKLSPLLVLPGVDMSGLSIFPNLLRLGIDRDVHVLLAGYQKNQTIGDIISCSEKYIKQSNITTFNVVGESFGGVVAVSLCKYLSNKIESVILFNPAFEYENSKICKYIHSDQFNKKKLSRFIVQNGPNLSTVFLSFLKFYYYFPCYIQDYVYSHLMMVVNMIVTKENEIFNRLNFYFTINEKDIYRSCKKIEIPVKLIISKKDNILSCDYIEVKSIPNFKIIEIENGAHLVSFSEINVNKLL